MGEKPFISVASFCLMVRGLSPSVEKLSRGLPNVHSLPMWNFLYGAKIGGSGTLDYPLRAEKNFSSFFSSSCTSERNHMRSECTVGNPLENFSAKGDGHTTNRRKASTENMAFFFPCMCEKKTKAMNGLKILFFFLFFFLTDTLKRNSCSLVLPSLFYAFPSKKLRKKRKRKKRRGLVFEPHTKWKITLTCVQPSGWFQ